MSKMLTDEQIERLGKLELEQRDDKHVLVLSNEDVDLLQAMFQEFRDMRAENKRLHASLASLGWRPVECGVDGYRCGLCVACGGHESEPPPIVVEVAK